MTKKKGMDARIASAVKAARRAGETVETKREAYRGSRVICHSLSSSTQTTIEIDSLRDSIDSSFSPCRKHGSRS